MRPIDADALLMRLPDDLPYKASVKRVLIQAPTLDVVPRWEVDRLRHMLDSYAIQYGTVKDQHAVIDRIKAETVRKMQEMLLAKKVTYGNITFRVVPVDDIDQIAKELLEGGNSNDNE